MQKMMFCSFNQLSIISFKKSLTLWTHCGKWKQTHLALIVSQSEAEHLDSDYSNDVGANNSYWSDRYVEDRSNIVLSSDCQLSRLYISAKIVQGSVIVYSGFLNFDILLIWYRTIYIWTPRMQPIYSLNKSGFSVCRGPC